MPVSRKELWRLILFVVVVNAIFTPPLFLVEAYARSDGSLSGVMEFVRHYGSLYPNIFHPGESRAISYLKFCITTPIKEEITARGPLWILVILFMMCRVRPSRVRDAIVGIAISLPTLWWAAGHPVMLPVFAAGILWGFLVYKTGNIWPAIFCHSTANIISLVGAFIEMRFHIIGI